jgi:anti-anti-sigma factor
VSIATDPVSRVITVRGSLALATSPALCAEIEGLVATGCERIVVDLRAAESADSTGLRALVGATQEAAIRACRLVVAIEPGSGLDRLLSLSGTREFPMSSCPRWPPPRRPADA